jgi:CRISPR/Cas system-associated endoribonuclease Cas2
MRRIFLILLLGLLPFPGVWAQEDKLSVLLGEREQLILEYQFYNQQNSNFWGKKSKKDLLQIIQTLKNIINKDSEIIREINTASLKKRAQTQVEATKIKQQVVDDQRLNLENLHQLKQDLASLQNRQKVKDRQLVQLREELQAARQNRHTADIIIAALGGSACYCSSTFFSCAVRYPPKLPPAGKSKDNHPVKAELFLPPYPYIMFRKI